MAQTQITYQNKIYHLSYELVGNGKKSMLILHGWGANKELMKQAFKENLKDFTQIYLDLPGFGNSSVEEVLITKDYAKIIQEFLKVKNLKITHLLGHSFGGKIATLLSLNNEIQTLILLSSAGILAPKSLKVRFKIRLFKIIKIFGLGKFYRYFASKDGANLSPLMYETFKKVVDEDFSEFFKQVSCKTLIFWGEKDTATPLESGKKIHSLIQKSEFYPLEGDHFFFLKHASFIAEKSKN